MAEPAAAGSNVYDRWFAPAAGPTKQLFGTDWMHTQARYLDGYLPSTITTYCQGNFTFEQKLYVTVAGFLTLWHCGRSRRDQSFEHARPDGLHVLRWGAARISAARGRKPARFISILRSPVTGWMLAGTPCFRPPATSSSMRRPKGCGKERRAKIISAIRCRWHRTSPKRCDSSSRRWRKPSNTLSYSAAFPGRKSLDDFRSWWQTRTYLRNADRLARAGA